MKQSGITKRAPVGHLTASSRYFKKDLWVHIVGSGGSSWVLSRFSEYLEEKTVLSYITVQPNAQGGNRVRVGAFSGHGFPYVYWRLIIQEVRRSGSGKKGPDNRREWLGGN